MSHEAEKNQLILRLDDDNPSTLTKHSFLPMFLLGYDMFRDF